MSVDGDFRSFNALRGKSVAYQEYFSIQYAQNHEKRVEKPGFPKIMQRSAPPSCDEQKLEKMRKNCPVIV